MHELQQFKYYLLDTIFGVQFTGKGNRLLRHRFYAIDMKYKRYVIVLKILRDSINRCMIVWQTCLCLFIWKENLGEPEEREGEKEKDLLYADAGQELHSRSHPGPSKANASRKPE